MEQKELQTIQNKIYEIRGQRVMLDFDLATMYGVETRRLNEQVKRNIERFPEDFMFQLTKRELEILRSQFVTSNDWKSQIATSKKLDNQQDTNLISQIAISRWGGNRKMPYAFTEETQGQVPVPVSPITGPAKRKKLSHMKYSSKRSDFLRFYAYLCHVIDDFACL